MTPKPRTIDHKGCGQECGANARIAQAQSPYAAGAGDGEAGDRVNR